MQNKINILIFGAGSVGTHHANAARSLKCNVLVCDVNYAQFEYMRNKLYPNRYGSWDKKIKFVSYKDVFEASRNYDLVIIGVPPHNHLKLIKKCFICLNFKKLLVEKPLCVFNQNFLFIKKKEYRNKIYCGFNHSISKSFLFLLNLISKKKIGNVKNIEINWKEDFKLILKAHPWIGDLKESYLSNLSRGGGGCHEYSHAIHLAVIFKKILFNRKKIKLKKEIAFKKKGNLYYDSKAQISFSDKFHSINLNINTFSNPCQKNIKLIGDKGTILWERKIEKEYEKIKIKREKKVEYKIFKITRREDFINQIRNLLFERKKNNKISNIKIVSAIDVMKVLNKIFCNV